MKNLFYSVLIACLPMLATTDANAASDTTNEVEVGKTIQLDISALGLSAMANASPSFSWTIDGATTSPYFSFTSKQWNYAVIKGVKASKLIGIQYAATYYKNGVRKEFYDVFYVKVVSEEEATAGPTAIEVYPSPQTLKVGQTSYIYAKQTGAIGGTYFYSEDTSIATVTLGELTSERSYTTAAVITAVSPGTVNIVAKSQNGIYAKCKVTVTPPECTEISIPVIKEMNVGTTWTVSPSITPSTASPTLSWKTTDSNVAAVTQAGVVTAKSPGIATISVTTDNGKSASCIVTVKDPNPLPTAITMEEEISLEVSQTYTLNPTLTPSNAKTTLTWKSSDTKVATVRQDGTVTAVAPGSAEITVTTSNGLSATCRVVIEGSEPIAEFDLPFYVSQGGKVICNNMSIRGFKKSLFYEDDDIVMTILPDKGYDIAGVWVDGADMTDKVDDDMLTVTGLTAGAYVVVSFVGGTQPDDKPGDVNQDGTVDISDIVKVINIIAEGEDE